MTLRAVRLRMERLAKAGRVRAVPIPGDLG
jgi:hypothetical protein